MSQSVPSQRHLMNSPPSTSRLQLYLHSLPSFADGINIRPVYLLSRYSRPTRTSHLMKCFGCLNCKTATGLYLVLLSVSLARSSNAVRDSLSGSPFNASLALIECSSANLAVRSAPDDFEMRYRACDSIHQCTVLCGGERRGTDLLNVVGAGELAIYHRTEFWKLLPCVQCRSGR